MNKIKVICTGGTIDKTYGSKKGTRNLSFGQPAIKNILDNTPVNFEYKISNLFQIDSLDMTASHRHQILDHINSSEINNILITHGTDTMDETGRFLSNKDIKKSVVLTGSSKPYQFRDSDAEINIGTALSALDLINESVKIAIHGRVFSPDCVIKKENGLFKNRF